MLCNSVNDAAHLHYYYSVLRSLFNLILICLFFLSLLAAGGWYAKDHYFEKQLKVAIENALTKRLGFTTVEDVKMEWTYPLKLRVGAINVKGFGFTFNLDKMFLYFKWTSKWQDLPQIKGDWVFDIHSPQVHFTTQDFELPSRPHVQKVSNKNDKKESLWWGLQKWVDPKFTVMFYLRHGFISKQLSETSYASIKSLDISINKKDLFDELDPLIVRLGSTVSLKTNGGEYAWPFYVKTDKLFTYRLSQFKGEWVVGIPGVAVTGKGFSNLNKESHKWFFDFLYSSKNASQLPEVVRQFGELKGDLKGQLDFSLEKNTPTVSGKIVSKDLIFVSNFKKGQSHFKGPGKINIDMELGADTFGVSIPRYKLDLDLKDTLLYEKGLLAKDQNVAASVGLVGAYTNSDIDIKNMLLRFNKTELSMLGNFSLKTKQLMLKFNPQKTTLNGLDKVFDVFKGIPTQGSLAINGSMNANLKDIEQTELKLENVQVQGFRSRINYENKSAKALVRGNMKADLKLKVFARGQQLEAAQLDLFLDGSGLELVANGKRVKGINEAMAANLSAEKKGNIIKINPSSARIFGGEIKVLGEVKNIFNPVIQMNFSAKKISLSPIAFAYIDPKTTGLKMNGNLSLDGSLNGQIDYSAPFLDNSLRLKGKALAAFSKVELANVVKEKKIKTSENGPTVKHMELDLSLPAKPLFQRSQFVLNLAVTSMNLYGADVSGVSFQGGYDKGKVKFSGELKKLFGGPVYISGGLLNLEKNMARVDLGVNVPKLNLSEALEWAAPQYKGMVSGIGSSKAQIGLPLSGKVSPIIHSTVVGTTQLSKTRVSSLNLANLLAKELSKIPGVVKELNKVGDAEFSGRIGFQTQDGILRLPELSLRSTNGDSYEGVGEVDLTNKLNVKSRGKAQVNLPGIGGDFVRANTEAGLLVVPIILTGPLYALEANLSKGTVNEMKNKFVEYQRSKAKETVKKAVDTEVNKIKKQAEDKLKKLFN